MRACRGTPEKTEIQMVVSYRHPTSDSTKAHFNLEMDSVASRNDNDKHDDSGKPLVYNKPIKTLEVLREGEATLHLVPPILDHLFIHLFTHLFSGCVCLVAQSCPTLCNPLDCTPSGSSVHGIFQARIPQRVAIFLLQWTFLT